MDYNSLTDEELKQRLEDGILVEELEDFEGWKILNEACKRTARKAERELLNISANETVRIIELQQIAKLYSTVLPSLLNFMKDESRIAFDALIDRGVRLTE